ncbi:MAG: alpha-amylase family glycosyl hydrolase, partial [Bacteroidota bacterium]
LLMPDRFANGNTDNDVVPGMREQTQRANPDGRHGGDLEGIRKHLDYFTNLGVTALWLNPVLENNMPAYSYHGYAITDYYAIDAHLGTLEEYNQLIDEAHDKGLKIIMDMVLNHCGLHHWWMDDLPTNDWVHQFPEYTPSNYRNMVKTDPYASDYDTRIMGTGWFDRTMPDLNQKQPLLANYLIQNAIWWIETSGIDGIRLDTQPYSSKEMVSEWARRIREAYPDFTIVGEAWVQRTAPTAYWQENTQPQADYNSHIQVITDFPMHFALAEAFNEKTTWTEGLARLYYVLAQDFVYPNAMNTLTFADNHDLSRIFTLLGEDLNKLKMAMGFLLTTRGIPMIYSGTEILQTGFEHDGHGQMRKDFPGGWGEDKVNFFDSQQRKGNVKEFHTYLSKLLSWRKDAEVIHKGRLTQFIPSEEQYVYFRHTDEACLMVILNNDNKAVSLYTERFKECLEGFSHGKDIITQELIEQLDKIQLAPKSIRIIELKP